VSALVLGDGSGGNRSIILEFNPSSAPRSTLMYSLEMFTVTDDSNLAKAGNLRVINLDPIPGLGAIALTHRWTADIAADQTAAHLASNAQNALKRIFLGRQAVAAVAASLRYDTDNVDTAICTVTAEGYFWGPRSINALGGPSRPLQGIYSV